MKDEERRDIIICPKCNIEMLPIKQKTDWIILKCYKCGFSISSDYWALYRLKKEE